MRIEYTKIFGKNFNSLGEFELEITPGRHLIIGENLDAKSSNSNGTGKSSLGESVVWTQYKKSPRGNDPSRDQKGDCETGYECKIGEQEYRIERYHKHKKFGNCSRIILNGEEVSHRLSSDTDTEIGKLIPIPYDLFVSTSVVLQGLPINFSQFTPSVRKTIIEDALGFHIWDKIRTKFSDKISTEELSKEEIESEFKKYENLMVSLNAKLESAIADTSSRTAELDNKAKTVKREINAIKKKATEITADIEALMDKRTINDLSIKRMGLNGELSSIQTKMADLVSIIKNEVCPTCGTAYPENKMENAKKELKALKAKLPSVQEAYNEMDKTITNYNQLSSDLRVQETLMSSKKRDLSNLLSEMAANAEPENDKVAELKTKLEETVSQVNAVNERLHDVTKRIEGLQFIDRLLLPSSPFRTKVLEKYLVHITGIIDQISPLVYPEIEIQLAINNKATGIDLLITRGGRVIDYKTLSGGEKRRLDIIIILAFLRFLVEASGVSTNLVILDEIFDALDTRGIESVISCIDALFPDDFAVYVISHNTELKNQFDSIIKVEKRGGKSYLV